MKKSRLFAFIASIIMIATVSYFVKKSPSVKIASNPTITTPPQKLSEQLKDFPGLEKSTLSEVEKTTACGTLFEKLEIYSVKTLVEDIKNNELKLDVSCFEVFYEKYPLMKGFPQSCELDNQGQLSVTCQSQLMAAKAIRIHLATKDQSTETLSTDLLINRLIALLTSQSIETQEGMKVLREVGRELYARLPNNESAAKAAGIGYLVDENQSLSDQQIFSDIGTEIRNRFPDNWEIYEINLLSKKNLNAEDYFNTVLSTYDSNPNSAIANYHMGCVQWKYKKYNEARVYFQKALQLSPHHKRFSETLKKSSDTSHSAVCQVEIGFSPDNF